MYLHTDQNSQYALAHWQNFIYCTPYSHNLEKFLFFERGMQILLHFKKCWEGFFFTGDNRICALFKIAPNEYQIYIYLLCGLASCPDLRFPFPISRPDAIVSGHLCRELPNTMQLIFTSTSLLSFFS